MVIIPINLIEMLSEKKLTISTAESLTGGLIASSICSVPGASEVFAFSAVTYSNEMKIKVLNVNSDTLLKYGAVSKETALEMLRGIKKISLADICISTTGLAGPTGSDINAIVGDVYIGYSIYDIETVKKYHFNGSRNDIRILTVNTALEYVKQSLL